MSTPFKPAQTYPFRYLGEGKDNTEDGRNIGRFGFVKTGDIIETTYDEAKSLVQEPKRFKEITREEADKIVAKLKTAADKKAAENAAVATQADADAAQKEADDAAAKLTDAQKAAEAAK